MFTHDPIVRGDSGVLLYATPRPKLFPQENRRDGRALKALATRLLCMQGGNELNTF